MAKGFNKSKQISYFIHKTPLMFIKSRGLHSGGLIVCSFVILRNLLKKNIILVFWLFLSCPRFFLLTCLWLIQYSLLSPCACKNVYEANPTLIYITNPYLPSMFQIHSSISLTESVRWIN